MEQEKKSKGVRARRYITITDKYKWEMIDRIMTVKSYSKSFNKVIDVALSYGLPILEMQLFDTYSKDGETVYKEKPGVSAEHEFFFQVIRLLREVLVNLHMNKAMLSSVFAYMTAECKDANMKKQLEDGVWQMLPDFLFDDEIQQLKEINK